MRQIITLLVFTMLSLQASAQIEGDNIFQKDQILTIELTFNQVGFWDSLTLNYESSTYMKADLVLTDTTGSYTFQDVGVRLKGNSSYSHPGTKKSFKIDFNKYVSGQNYDGLKKLNFSNGFKDPSLMREKVFFDVCRAANVPAPRANFANVYFNGTLWGFYTVIEQIDDQFLDWRILDDDGNLFKAGDNFGGGPGGGTGSEADLKYYGEDQAEYEERYELKSNESENDWSDLIRLVDFIDNSSDDEFESDLKDWVELDEYLRSVALDNLFSNLDSYTGSARNYYIYHNLTTDKWEWIKWDGNESFGSYRGGPGLPQLTSLDLNYSSNNRPLLQKLFASESLYNDYTEQICWLTSKYFNTDYLHPKIDKLKDLIQSSVYQDNDKMYSNNDFDINVESDISSGGGPGGGTVYGLKSFVTERAAFVQSQLDCSGFVSVLDDEITNLNISPNPVQSNMTVTWENPGFSALEIHNSIGQLVFKKAIKNQNQISIDLSEFARGIYSISLKNEQGLRNEKISRLIIKH